MAIQRGLAFQRLLPGILLSVFAWGCTTPPYLAEKREFRDALAAGQHERAVQKADQALAVAPPERRPRLERFLIRSLFRDAWREHRAQRWDNAFAQMVAAHQRAPANLREDWADECRQIAQQYAAFHSGRAGTAVQARDMRTAIAEYELAGKADNALGREALAAVNKYTMQRKALETRLENAKTAVEREAWGEAATVIAEVRAQDASLAESCDRLSGWSRTRHCQAALRDGRGLLEKQEFGAALAKTNEALALEASSGATELKQAVQAAFTDSVDGELKQALAKDDRSTLDDLARRHDAFELAPAAARIRAVLASRGEADRLTATARELIGDKRYEAALEPLHQACGQWPENQQLAKLYQETRIQAGTYALAVAEHAAGKQCPLVCALYCWYALILCPAEAEIQEKAQAGFQDALGKIDRRTLTTAFEVEIALGNGIETVFDVSNLQQAISQAVPAESRFVSVAAPGAGVAAGNVFRVSVEVGTLFVATREQTFNKVFRYVSEVTHDPNPEYIQLQADLNAAQCKMVAADNEYQEAQRLQNQAIQNQQMYGGRRDFLSALNALGAVGGGVGMEAARSKMMDANREYQDIAQRMSNTSATVPRSIYADYPYVVHHVQRWGTLKAMIRIRNAAGAVVAERPIAAGFNQTDTANDGYAPVGLSEDPLELPDEEAVRAQFVRELYATATTATPDLVGGCWRNALASAASVPEPFARWERQLALAVQAPSLREAATGEIRQNLVSLPADFIEQMATRLTARQ